MALTELHITGSGSNINAGSTTSNTASVTSTNGDWGNAAANRFTAASGTPFSGVSIGELVSISLDAATSAVYITKITAVNAGGASIDTDSTLKIGSAPTTGATGRSARVGGAWQNLDILTTLTGTAGFSVRINLYLGTYALTTTLRALTIAGTATVFVEMCGCTSSPGDLDSLDADRGVFASATKTPLITSTTGRFQLGAAVTLRNVDIQGATTTGAVSALTLAGATQGLVLLDRVRVENTSATANGYCIYDNASGAGNVMLNSEFKATTSATACIFKARRLAINSSKVTGGISGIVLASGTAIAHIGKTEFISPGTHGIDLSGAISVLATDSCTFYGGSASGNGINISSIPTQASSIDCLFASWVYGISSTASIGNMLVANCDFYNNSSGTQNNFGDYLPKREQLDTADPFVNVSGGNLNIVGTSKAKDNGCVPFQDIGARQIPDSIYCYTVIVSNIGVY